MTDRFNLTWNPHYDFTDEDNLREIARVDCYTLEMDRADYRSGQLVDSPWGSNQVLEAKQENGIDVCIKRITVLPGFMLSLQRHRGREELWEVKEGSLTVMKYGLSKVGLARLEDLELSERECNPVFEDCIEPGDPFPGPGPGPRPKRVDGVVVHPADPSMDW